jgi:hypothetical protein
MNWKLRGRKRSWPDLRYYPGICLEGQGQRNLNHICIFFGEYSFRCGLKLKYSEKQRLREKHAKSEPLLRNFLLK